MDNDDRLEGETSTVRTHDRGEISGKPVGSAEHDDAESEELIKKQSEETKE